MGAVVPAPTRHPEEVRALAMEALSALRALKASPALAPSAPGTADFVVLVVDSADPEPALPDLRDRAAAAVGVSGSASDGRAAVLAARKRLRAAGAALGARELLLAPSDFGVTGLESDGHRERLQDLLQALLQDASRLRLKREGWEEP